MATIQVNNLYKVFGHNPAERAMPLVNKGESKDDILAKTGCTVAISDASFEIPGSEIFVVMGLSGSGKSTLIRCINRLIEPTAGSVKLDDEEVTKMSKRELNEIRRKKLGMVFQRFGLLPHRTVLDNAAFGLEVQGIEKSKRHEKAADAIDLVGLGGYKESMTQELSGGMQQRVGLARALANDPEILLMDEAFSALDPLIRVNLQDELLELQARMHKTILFITHDLDEALKLGDRIAIMKDGVIVQIGTPEEILTHPANDYVKAFVENVDRSKVLTANSVKKKTEATVFNDAGPHQCARKMRQLGLSSLLVLDHDRKFKGYITIDETLQLAKKVPESEDDHAHQNIGEIIKEDIYTVSDDTALSEMFNEAAKSSLPAVVISENNHFEGIVTRPAILAAIAGD
jgi:glycine betaine/proline transport system ATP-binding protein